MSMSVTERCFDSWRKVQQARMRDVEQTSNPKEEVIEERIQEETNSSKSDDQQSTVSEAKSEETIKKDASEIEEKLNKHDIISKMQSNVDGLLENMKDALSARCIDEVELNNIVRTMMFEKLSDIVGGELIEKSLLESGAHKENHQETTFSITWKEFLQQIHETLKTADMMKTEAGFNKAVEACKKAITDTAVSINPDFDKKVKHLKGDEFAFYQIPYIKDKQQRQQAAKFTAEINKGDFHIDNGLPLWAAVKDAGYLKRGYVLNFTAKTNGDYVVAVSENGAVIKKLVIVDKKWYYVTNP